MLPAVTDIMQTREYAEFADRVLASHGRAYQQYALDISPAMRQNAGRDASLLEPAVWHCSMRAPRHDGQTDSREVCSN